MYSYFEIGLKPAVVSCFTNAIAQWFPKWVVPPPWGRWSRNGRLAGEAEMVAGGDRRPS